MDNEIINLYIQKQKNLISEFQSKLLLLETQFELLQKKNSETLDENAKLKSDLEKLQKKPAKTADSTL
jgi:regulator of replication initiation timing